MSSITTQTDPSVNSQKHDTFALHALLAFIGSVVLILFVGSRIQHYDLSLGLLVTELAFIALPAGLVLRQHRQTLDASLFARPKTKQLFLTALIGLCAATIAVYKGVVSRRGLTGVDPSGANALGSLSLSLIVLLMIVAPLCEEFLFRAMLQNSLNRLWSNRTSVLTTAIFFGLYHLNLLRFTETFVLGFFSGIVFLKTRNLWCSVLLHVTCNALGPILLQHASQLGLLLNPITCIGLTFLAVACCYQLGPKMPPTVTGLWQRFRWAMFGTTEAALESPTGSRRITIFVWSIGLTLLLFLSYLLAVTITHSGGKNLQARLNAQMAHFDYVVTEKDTWTILSSEQVSARSELFIKKRPTPYHDLTITLPFKEATLLLVKIGSQNVPYSHLKESDYRLVLSGQLTTTPNQPITVLWQFPFASLTALPDGYRTPLKSLAPSDYLSLDIAVAENSGFRLLWNKGNSTQRVVYITPDKIRMEYGSCSLGIEREKAPSK